MFALPIFPGSRPPSIVGANELNFCVRDGREPERRLWRSQARAQRVPRSARDDGVRAEDIRRAPQTGTSLPAACGGVKGKRSVCRGR